MRQRVHAMDHPPHLERSHLSAVCLAVRHRLDAYIDDELGAQDTHDDAAMGPAEMAAHLDRCPPCRVVARQLEAQKRRLRLLATRLATHVEERASDALRDRIDRLRAG